MLAPGAPKRKLVAGDVLVDRYRLERVIGEGGMGVVFAAHDRQTNEIVAVKVLSPEADGETLERFHREARLATRLKNEHVVRIYDVHHADGALPPFLVMEYLDGRDLSVLLDERGALPVDEAIGYVLQACEALAEAHAIGIVHRDLKPSNLYLTRRADGDPLLKILDFGISKTPDDDEIKLTTTRSVFGSPAYMPPEQIRSAKHVDARADVWALAVVLYELVSKQLPFSGDTAASMLAAISADAPLPLRDRSPHAISPDLERIIAACLVKDRSERTASIEAFAAALVAFTNGRPLAAGLTTRLVSSAVPPRSSRPADPLPEAAMARTDHTLGRGDLRQARSRMLLGAVMGVVGVLLVAFTVARVFVRGDARAETPAPAIVVTSTLEPVIPSAAVVAAPSASVVPSAAPSEAPRPRGAAPKWRRTPAAVPAPTPPPSDSQTHVRNVDFNSRQ